MFWGMLAAVFGAISVVFLLMYFTRKWRIQLVAVMALLITT